MSVYVDDMEAPFGNMVMCHLLADTTEELLVMADKIGVQRKWLQHGGTFKEHFDIALSKRALAVQHGAREISWREASKMVFARRNPRKVAGVIELVQGDCIEVLARQPEGAVDVVVCSPPYNLGVKYRSYADTISRKDYLEWTVRWLTAVHRVLSAEGSLFLNIAGKPSSPMGPFEVLMAACSGFNGRWVLQNTFYWVKSITVPGPDGAPHSVGHFKPLNSERFVNDCVEFVFHLTKTGSVPLDRLAIGVPYADKSNVGRFGAEGRPDIRCRGNAWHIPYETITNREKDRPHPASFSPLLAEWCFKLHGLSRIRKTLDPFLGIGSTAVASAKLGLPHLGIELDPTDIREAATRVASAGGVVAQPTAIVATRADLLVDF
jgi:site-specific DNA-methyltransferase (adenine-specific)